MAPTDADLLKRLRERDPETLRVFVEGHVRRVYRTARGMGCQDDEAQDVTQEVFVTFLESLDRFEGRSQASTWLFGILHRKVQERRRARARELESDPIDDAFAAQFDDSGRWMTPPLDPDRALTSAEAARAIEECLGGLSPLQRAVFHLREVEELPARDVSNIVGETITHIGVLLHRARTRLRGCLGLKGWRAAP